MKKLSKEEAISLYNWIQNHKEINWGAWTDYPKLCVGANYLQYDDAPCVVKLSEPVYIDEDNRGVKYISAGRNCPGASTTNHITVDTLLEFGDPEAHKARWEALRKKWADEGEAIKDRFLTLPEGLRNDLIKHFNELSSRKFKAYCYTRYNELQGLNAGNIKNAIYMTRKN